MPKPAVTRINGAFQVQSDYQGNPSNPSNINGFYAPKLTTTQITAIPATTLTNGAIVYNTTTNTFQVYQNGAWTNLSTGATNALVAPNLTTANRPNPASTGMIYYDTTLNNYQIYQNGQWGSLAAGIGAGANTTAGSATLAAGTIVVASTYVTANSNIFLQTQGTIGAANSGNVRVSATTPGTNFTITSTDNADTSIVRWLIINP